jgi:MFS family permease
VTKTKAEGLGPSFNRLWSASLASNLADGIFKTSAPLLAATLTKDPIVISLMAALVMLPWLLFAIPIGGIVDRIDRRLLLATANAVRFLMAAYLATMIALDLITIPVLYLVVFVFGIAEVLYDTTAQSMIPQILKPKNLERGNARLEVGAVTVGEFIGAPISGILFAVAIAIPFFVGGAGVLLAGILVLTIPGNFKKLMKLNENQSPMAQTKFWSDIRFGISYLYNHKVLLKLVLFTSTLGFFFAATGSTMVLFLTQTLEVTPALFGFVFTVPAIGAIIGSITGPKVSAKYGRTNVMAFAIVTSSAITVATGLSPTVYFFVAFGLINAITITWWNILLMSSYHQIIPNELFGRIHGTRRTLVWGMMPIGSIAGGVIAQFGLRMPYLIAGSISLLIAIIGIKFIISLKNLLSANE